jgi:predicted  nucleic acid-binding Zn-ribbon protein
LATDTTASRLITHLESLISDKRLDEERLAVTVADLINAVSLLQSEIRALEQRVSELEGARTS